MKLSRFAKISILVGAVFAAVASTVIAQPEAQRFLRAVEVHRGRLFIGSGATGFLQFDGATFDSNETTLTVVDPTADRTWTFQNASDTVVGLATTDTLTNKTITQPVMRELTEIVTAANVLTAADCGATFYLNAAAGFLTTLPSPTSLGGCNFRFVVHTATSTNGYTIGTPTDNIMFGMVVERAGGAGVACSEEDLITMVNGQSVKGDWLSIRTDGTSWYVHGMTDVSAGFTCSAT